MNAKGFFVPVFDEKNRIQALSIHLDEPFNGMTSLWFSSKGRINGTTTRNYIYRNNITKNTKSIILTDDLILVILENAIVGAFIVSFIK